MLRRKMSSVIATVLATALMGVNASAIAPIGLEANNGSVVPLAASNEISSGYDTTFTTGTHGYGVRGYEPAYILHPFSSRGYTEVWGDHELETADHTPYAYVLINNSNNGKSNSGSSDEMNSHRHCSVYLSISSSHATDLTHTARLSIKGESGYNFSDSVSIPG